MSNGNEDIGNKIDDALSYPILTEEVRLPASRRSGDGGGAASDAAQTVESTLRNILGWRVRDNDPKSFVAALTKSFESREVQGHTEWNWTPHTYSIEANMGAVTGAQAAIYSRARIALNQALPLLDGLQTLLAVSDQQEVEATTAIVRSSVTELVNELGREGGPRVTRVDEYFLLLLGKNPDQLNSENVGGQLGALRDTFGLRRKNVNTISEEQNLTNFLILVDDINALRLTWDSQKSFFERNSTNVFLGTQLVLLGRTLAVVAESVQEAYFAMDSVFLGPAERQVTSLDLGTGSPVFLGELLEWVDHFAVTEGPRLISEGGKNGVIKAFSPTVEKLTDLVGKAADVSKGIGSNPTKAFHSTRVANRLEDLHTQLNTTAQLAAQIKREPPPQVTFVDPESAENSGSVRLTINGTDFQEGAEVVLHPTNLADPDADEITAEVLFIAPAELNATLDIKDASAGSYAVIVTNPDSQTSNSFAFTVTAPPAVENVGVKQEQVFSADGQVITVTGNNFDPNTAAVSLKIDGADTRLGEPALFTKKELRAVFDLRGVTAKSGTVVVQSASASLTAGTVNIVSRTPVILNVNPVALLNDPNQKLTINGSNFGEDVKVRLRIESEDPVIGLLVSFSNEKLVVSFDLSNVIAPTSARLSVENPGASPAEKDMEISDDNGGNAPAAEPKKDAPGGPKKK